MKKNAKKAAATTAIALLTAASVVTGSLFDSPAALLPDDGASAVVYTVGDAPDGADDDAGVEEDESGETRRRGGVRAALRARVLRLPLIVRLLFVMPLWALGSVILAGAGAAWALLQPVLGKIAGFALLLALLLGAFLIAAKAAFPDLPLKKLLNRRSFFALLLGAAGLSALDALLPAVWGEYARAKDIVLSVGFFLVLCCAAVPFALREQRRRLQNAAAERTAEKTGEKKPRKLVFTDAGGTFTVTVSAPSGKNA